MLLILVVFNVFFALTSENYLSVENIFNMLKQSAMVIIVASAATILMMTGNFDLINRQQPGPDRRDLYPPPRLRHGPVAGGPHRHPLRFPGRGDQRALVSKIEFPLSSPRWG